MFKSHYTYNQQITAVSKDKWYLNIYLSLLTLKNVILVLHCNYNILLRRLNWKFAIVIDQEKSPNSWTRN